MIWKDTEQYKILYEKNPSYGSDGNRNRHIIHPLIQKFKIKSIYDFGCGINHTLINSILAINKNISITGYDPAISTNTNIANNIISYSPVDLLISTDCLEHIYEDELSNVWNIFNTISPSYMFLIICTRLAVQILPNNTNAHKTVESGEWWKTQLINNFPNYYVNFTNKFYEENIKKEAHFWLIKKNLSF